MAADRERGPINVPARECRAVRVRAGERFRVTDLEGSQVGDVFAFCSDDVSEYASAEHIRVHVDRLFPRVGEHFVTNRRRPILLFAEDSSPGVHDLLMAACDPTRYEGLGVKGWHASCQQNLREAMANLGHGSVETPQPINLFQNVEVGPDGAFKWGPALTEPGDSVVFRAELDCHVVLCACPMDIVAINRNQPTALAIEVLD